VNRILIIAGTLIVVVVVVIVVWNVVNPSEVAGTAGAPASAPAPQKFDTTSGQEMKPRWNATEREGQGNGGADGAADN
tara:strand:- start:661 stop:894 length:234 start_codon:yes stop_codon:yes gene_type:complete